jgi:serine/threonine-protein kinase
MAVSLCGALAACAESSGGVVGSAGSGGGQSGTSGAGQAGTGGSQSGKGGAAGSGAAGTTGGTSTAGAAGAGGSTTGRGGSIAGGGGRGGSSAGSGGRGGTGGSTAGTTGTGGRGGSAGTTGTGGRGGTGGSTAGTTGRGGTGGSSAGTGGSGRGGSSGSTGTGGAATAYRFPASSTIYQDISGAAVDSESTTIMTALQNSGWGSGLGIDVSFTILTADASVARRPFVNGGDDPDCDTAPVPLPPGGNTEGNPDYHCADGGDCHILVYQGTRLYELYQGDVTTGGATGGTFSGSCLVVWDLTHDYWQPAAPPNFSRGDHCNGADAADLPMTALILTPTDVSSGELTHALRFTIPNSHIRKGVYVHPATHIGGPTGGSDQMPYGARLRLKSTYDLSQLPSDAARVIARGLQKYGMIMSDGGNLFVSATTDVDQVVSTSALRSIKATDFEMIDGGTRINWSDYQCQRTVISN